MSIKKNDIEFGLEQEDKKLPLLRSFFSSKMKKETNKFAKYDYYTKKTYYELKSRNNKYDTYPTTMIATDKVIPDCDRRQRFVFNFTDGVYYITYNKELFDEKVEIKMGGRNDRGQYEYKPYFYIPIYLLKKVEVEKNA